jgi:glycosyltransferase involved in cell wall biosynthesis
MFLIAGELSTEFKKKFAYLLENPSVLQLGHRRDVPVLMRNADILIFPTLEEGSPLVCMEAIGSGCVPLVSTVCEGVCRHGKNALIHNVGDVDALRNQISELYRNRELMAQLRKGCLESRDDLTWSIAANSLKRAYEEALQRGTSQTDQESHTEMRPHSTPHLVA